ncbi:concanavalin A-like lectin/glucanase domain-containing protein [Crepidotus variabilis]|uniref:Concanavalin A-like lectin/glucanase domain-containing protein n=1 Tax=Crepidotus variabilis TaxID=179855 RepID=A0A9P6EN21_9AGAR|nr:concanavalin A-like lectin/glucanase domain-containing protein [Crepidotus variabilis]
MSDTASPKGVPPPLPSQTVTFSTQQASTSTGSRPNTANTITTATDPFASPNQSRTPSIHQQPPSPSASSRSFPTIGTGSESTGLGPNGIIQVNPFSPSVIAAAANANATPSGVNPSPSFAAPRRSILVQSGFGNPAFSSARSSMARLHAVSSMGSLASSIPATPGSPGIPGGSAVGNTNAAAAPKTKVPRMKSHMIDVDSGPSPVEKPWLAKKNPRAVFSYWIVWITIFIGIAGGGIQSWYRYKNVALDRQPLCLVMEENFDDETSVFGKDGKGGTFFREVNMDGFGNGQFDMTTSSHNNSFISNGHLYIVPTLTGDNIGSDAVFDGTVYNITDCTFNLTRPNNGYITYQGQQVFDTQSYLKSCSAVSNKTAATVINPVQSARLTTKYSANIRYGRVEVRAKMPNGDWMWPAIWMLPKDEVYGAWPRSGEIDIVESRGNGLRYTARGSNYVQGSLNWGPSPELNGVSKSYSWWSNKRKSFGSDFHTYALEWTPEFLRIYVDTRLHTLLDFRFNKPFFNRGDFPDVVFNGSSLVPLANPWINGTNSSPFDQEFYLIMNVGVGSTNGWFPESQGNKPWLDRAQHPPHDFAQALAQWYPTWPTNVEDRAMVVDYVKMWKHC